MILSYSHLSRTLSTFERSSGNRKNLKYDKPTIWQQPRSRVACYFCNTDNCSSLNRGTRPKIQHAPVSSVEKAVITPKTHMPRKKTNEDDIEKKLAIQRSNCFLLL